MFYEEDDFLLAMWPCFLFDLLLIKKSYQELEFSFGEKNLTLDFFLYSVKNLDYEEGLTIQERIIIQNRTFKELDRLKPDSLTSDFFSSKIPNQWRELTYVRFLKYKSPSQGLSKIELKEIQETWFDLILWYENWADYQVVCDKALEGGEIEKPPIHFRRLFESFSLTKFFYEWYTKKSFPFSRKHFYQDKKLT